MSDNHRGVTVSAQYWHDAARCTLAMDIYSVDRKQLHRRQSHRRQWRGDVPAYLDTPEIVQFV
ncbi:MAG TPA: hypothetical protein VNA16_11135 [Abditibacteriaceae bacterium]|nr:hypothetical protein [Abditibacteriaceae bacterium]